MASFSFGVIKVNDQQVVVDSFAAMYHRAEKAGDERLMRILRHRADAHDGGPCHCKTIP